MEKVEIKKLTHRKLYNTYYVTGNKNDKIIIVLHHMKQRKIKLSYNETDFH